MRIWLLLAQAISCGKRPSCRSIRSGRPERGSRSSSPSSNCTAGDLLITVFALALAALAARIGRWQFFGNRMALTAILLGLGYTVFSEWLNTQVRQSWSYTEAMPLLPPFGTGLTPFLQWLIVPAIAFGYVRRKARFSDVISP